MSPLPAIGLIGVGGPESLAGRSGGSWDFGPIIVAVAALIVLRLVLGIPLRWHVVVLALLGSPLAIAFAGWVGPPIAFGFAAIGLVVARRILGRSRPPRTV